MRLLNNKFINDNDSNDICKLAFKLFKKPLNLTYLFEISMPLYKHLNLPNNIITVYNTDNKVIGFATYCKPEKYMIDNYYIKAANINNIDYDKNSYGISYIGIDTPYQHKGIGTKILKSILKIAKQNNITSIYSLCWKDKSLSLFNKVGFKSLLQVDNCYADGSFGTVVNLTIC